jgi:hypothetical protein
MGDLSTPFTTSPPYVQLLVVLVINTGIFIGSALVQKALGVDILPIVIWVPGHPHGGEGWGMGGLVCWMVRDERQYQHQVGASQLFFFVVVKENLEL